MIRKIIILLILCCTSAIAAPVNVNLDTADQIAKSLNGIGPSKAAAIVQYREVNGPFKTVDELKYVKGIGKKIIDKNKQDIILVVENN